MFKACLTVIFVSGAVMDCASQAAPQSASTAGVEKRVAVLRGTIPTDRKLICSQSRPLGSHIPEQVCITRAAQELQRKKTRERVHDLQTAPAPFNNCNATVC
ncbi:MAG: hypothetical protein KGK44_04505 [Gammaproteobacteria bacterium]|nr:hypothetical protein [Gammaproteobacteria bacterium]